MRLAIPRYFTPYDFGCSSHRRKALSAHAARIGVGIRQATDARTATPANHAARERAQGDSTIAGAFPLPAAQCERLAPNEGQRDYPTRTR